MNNAYLKMMDFAFSKIFNDPNIDKGFKEAVKPATPEHNVCKYCNFYDKGYCDYKQDNITDLTGCPAFENDTEEDERSAREMEQHERNLVNDMANEQAGR